MTQFLLVMAVALTAGAIVFGITVLVTSGDPGLRRAEPDGRAVPLPAERPLAESDLSEIRFDTALRGYRMAQVDAALRRAGYDIGYKDELIKVLQAEVDALRDGRLPDAEVYRRAREAALAPVQAATPVALEPAEPTDAAPAEDADPAAPGDVDATPDDLRNPVPEEAGETAPDAAADEPAPDAAAEEPAPDAAAGEPAPDAAADETAAEPSSETTVSGQR